MIGILISTFERYERIAHFTELQIRKQWAGHPPIFFSGLLRQKAYYLDFKSDARDWMGVTLEAVEQMLDRGFTHAYLILDDHPPVGSCHDIFLNECLPTLAMQLNAVYIGLLGYGQHRSVNGVVTEKENGFLEKCSPAYLWKFSLHPGLWNLEALQIILKQRHATYHDGERTAWNFERHQDVPGDPVLGPLLSRCFRICGKHFLKEPGTMKRQIIREAIERFVIDLLLFCAKKIGGRLTRQELEKKLLWRYGHYLGPYPLFWSGLMQKGEPHEGFEKWLHIFGSKEFQRDWINILNNRLLVQMSPNSLSDKSGAMEFLQPHNDE